MLIFLYTLTNKKDNFQEYSNNSLTNDIAIYVDGEKGSIPTTSNYYLDLEETKCTLNGKELSNITFTYKNGKVGVYGISEANTKCNFYFKKGKYFTLISSSNIEEQDAILTNKMGAIGDFENSGWDSICKYDSTNFTHGKTSCHIVADSEKVETFSYSKYPIPFDQTHVYYASINVLANTEMMNTQMFWPVIEPHFLGINDINIKNKWHKMSAIRLNGIISSTVVNERVRLDFNNKYTSGDMYFDGLILIDLTDSYGDNIPTKDFLDKTLMYFDDTVNIKTVVNSIGKFKVSQINGTFECSEGATANIDSEGNITIEGASEYSTCVLK